LSRRGARVLEGLIAIQPNGVTIAKTASSVLAMTDKTAFTDAEWHAITDAPMLVTAAVFYAGEHGPISMLKEASASARAISRPGERGAANALIGEIVAEANTKETRAELKEHRGPTPQAAIENALKELEPAAEALKKLPADEAEQVAEWFMAIADAVAKSAKTVNADEQATLDKLAALFGVKRG
jgi:hypothetical protein